VHAVAPRATKATTTAIRVFSAVMTLGKPPRGGPLRAALTSAVTTQAVLLQNT
jgi:hypothetical protein